MNRLYYFYIFKIAPLLCELFGHKDEIDGQIYGMDSDKHIHYTCRRCGRSHSY